MTAERLQTLLHGYADDLSPEVLSQLSAYIDLVMRWNSRTNLTAIRDEDTLAQRQVGESLFARRFLNSGSSLLDFGSGAGFPGIPLLIAEPSLSVTLAESQGKKASFLREALRSLSLQAEVWPSRVEALPSDRVFDTVVLRAVDHTAEMLPVAERRVAAGGSMLRYLAAHDTVEQPGWYIMRDEPVPNSSGRLVQWGRTA